LKVDSAEAGLQRSGVCGLLLPHVRLPRQDTSPRSAVNHVGWWSQQNRMDEVTCYGKRVAPWQQSGGHLT